MTDISLGDFPFPRRVAAAVGLLGRPVAVLRPSAAGAAPRIVAVTLTEAGDVTLVARDADGREWDALDLADVRRPADGRP